MIIPGYTDYSLEKGNVYRKNNTQVTLQKTGSLKLKDSEGNWKSVALTKIKSLCGIKLQLPKNAKAIPFTNNDYFIDKEANVYSFTRKNPCGLKMKTKVGSKGYICVKIKYKDVTRKIELQQLMGITFLQQDYIEKGLVCMHLDDDKEKCELSNLRIGTYSQNNLDAYATGVNPSKK